MAVNNVKTEFSYMENILNNSFNNSYQCNYHSQFHGGHGGLVGGHAEGGHGDYDQYHKAYDALAGNAYSEEFQTTDDNDSGVTSEGTEEYNDETEDISNNDDTENIEVPLSAWKAKQLKLSVAGVMKRRRDANKRERKRMNGLNEAFEKLREHIPGGKKINNKKLSKIETLQMANMYIRNLVNILHQ